MLRGLGAVLAGGVLLAWAVAGWARPFTVDDLLRQASFGAAAFDPSGRWLVVEQRDPYETAARFDVGLNTALVLTRLRVVDLRTPGEARPLVADGDAAGLAMAGFSPSGARLAVFGWRGGTWSLGVVEMATGALHWLDVAPDAPRLGRSLQWLDEETLLVTALADGAWPWRMSLARTVARRLPASWAAAAQGDAALTVVGSGAFLGLRPRPPPKRLLRLSWATGRAEALAAGDILDIEVSPDRRRVAVLTGGAERPPHAGRPVQGAAGLAPRAAGLSIVDLASGAQRPVPGAEDVLTSLLSWSPDGRSLLVFRRGADGLWTDGRLLRVTATSGTTSAIAAGLAPVVRLRPEVVRAGWDGGDPVVWAQGAGAAPAAWYRLAPGGPMRLCAGPGGIAAAAAAPAEALPSGRACGSGAGRRSARVEDRVLPLRLPPSSVNAGDRPGEVAAWTWGVRLAGGRREVLAMTAAGPRRVAVAPAAGAVIAPSAPARAAVVRLSDPHGVETLWLHRADGPAVRLARINSHLADVDPPSPAAVRHRGADGRRVTSWFYRPAPGAGPPPLVIKPYPGDVHETPPGSRPPDAAGFMGDIRTLVGHGYAVLVPSLPRGPEPEGPMVGMAGRLAEAEADLAADPALAGAYDPDRVALLGYSFGGLATLAAITQTDRYRAAVALAGVSDVTAMWAKTQLQTRVAPEEGILSAWSAGNVEEGQFGLGAPPWAAPELYAANSPLRAADRVTTPVLLVTGDLDFPEQSEAMFSALYRQGKDAQLVTYWGEGHAILSPGNVRDLYGRIFGFLDPRLALTRPEGGAHPPSGSGRDGPRPRSPPPTGSGSGPRPR